MNYKNYQNVFKRYELKYMLDSSQYEAVKKAVNEHMNMEKVQFVIFTLTPLIICW